MYDFIFQSNFIYNVIRVIFFCFGIIVLMKKKFPVWLSKNVSSGSANIIGWILVSVAPISILLGLFLSYFKAWNIMFYLEPAIILISAIVILFVLDQNKR